MAFRIPFGPKPRKLLLLPGRPKRKQFEPTLENLGLTDVDLPRIPHDEIVVEREIGRGGFGRVQLVHQKKCPGKNYFSLFSFPVC